ncbi:MAG: nucleotidyltransferase domain-containing protein [Gammaproteobacteria bacterium]|jgi:predicted nucleotidyltransferase|nr:nucleotidyltransferase domain-containing protein [Gammaproteobacteria bacterium]
MRISPEQADTIRDVVRTKLGPGARVRLFGSRVDDAARGGDIDLFIEVDEPLANRAASASSIAAQCQLRLGDQRIDVVLVDPMTSSQPIHARARKEGILL